MTRRIVHIHIADDCPEIGKAHGSPSFLNGKRGMVLGEAPYLGHDVKVGIPVENFPNQWSAFQYFSPAELTEADESA
jgi:hypothetical protein